MVSVRVKLSGDFTHGVQLIKSSVRGKLVVIRSKFCLYRAIYTCCESISTDHELTDILTSDVANSGQTVNCHVFFVNVLGHRRGRVFDPFEASF